jgi:hypothetical protein
MIRVSVQIAQHGEQLGERALDRLNEFATRITRTPENGESCATSAAGKSVNAT